ncbi:MAG: CGNR zinc finger domain-containing protein [Hamadaea sp.]|nr:CGNR zinc finger domain-containing protein [Hamadaea sp.]
MAMEIRAHTFQPRDFVGGHLVLDFVNTVTGWDAQPVDWLDGYARLLDWAVHSGGFPADTVAALRRAADADPRAAERALTKNRHLRETLWEVLTALTTQQQPDTEALQAQWRTAAGRASLRPVDGHLFAVATVESSGLDAITHTLALAAVRFLEDAPTRRLRVCDGHPCGWFYLDTSKAGRRRWCDMATCGNAEKTRRHSAARR